MEENGFQRFKNLERDGQVQCEPGCIVLGGSGTVCRIAEEKKARVRALATRHGEVTQGKTQQQKTLGRMRKQLGELNDQLVGEAKIEDLSAQAQTAAAEQFKAPDVPKPELTKAPQQAIEDVRLVNVTLANVSAPFKCSNVSGTSRQVSPPPCPALVHHDDESILESLMAFKRAGASAIITYFALDIAKKIKKF